MGAHLATAALALFLHFSGYQSSTMTIHFPQGVTYVEACVYSAGWEESPPTGKRDFTIVEWWAKSCWTPRFSVEDYHFWPSAYWVRVGVAFVDAQGVGHTIWTPPTPIRPEPTR